MKTFIIIVILVAGAFIADKTIPSYDRHLEYIGSAVLANTKSKDLVEFGINILGTGVNVAKHTGCGRVGFGQLNIYSYCEYDDGKIKVNTFGIFDKIFVTK